MRKIYQLDPELVARSLTENINYAEHRRDQDIAYWMKARPEGDCDREQHTKDAQERYEEHVYEELAYYALVRIVMIGPKRFILVYGDEDNATVTRGTGPFKTLEQASNWFLKQGR